jgi:hypothetical protein
MCLICAFAPPASGASVPPRLILSYLLFAGSGVPQATPGDGIPSRKAVTEPWEWRLFDPATRRDTLFMTFDTFPAHMRWDPAFREVEFLLGDRVARAPWRSGAAMVEQVRLPSDSSVCDFWESRPGAWHALYQETFRTEAAEGYSYELHVATRWDHAKAAWVAAAVDTGGDNEGGCFTSERLEQDAPRPPRIEVQAMLDSMRIGNYQDSALSIPIEDPHHSFDAWVWVALREDRSMGLEMGAGTGDTYHAFAPVTWVDRVHSRRATVYAPGQAGMNDQIAFGVRGDFVLIASEYEGGNPSIVDVRDGNIVMRVDGPSARAVWVPTPEGWR